MDAIEMFKRAAVALQTDERYLALDAARRANDENQELQDMIGEFNLARMDLNTEISKEERDEARVAELNTKVNTLYSQIMASEGMVAYNEAKTRASTARSWPVRAWWPTTPPRPRPRPSSATSTPSSTPP